MTDPWKAGFARFLDAAAPYLEHLVIVGGWANQLHRLSELAVEPDYAPLRTLDVDAATPSRLAPRGQPLDARLRSYGFEEKFSSNFTPPITLYELSSPEGFEVEFVTDQPGGYEKRDGRADATVQVAGVTAQKLHYVRLLLVRPWTVRVEAIDDYPMDTDARDVRVANPVSYIVQKLLIHKHRGPKGAKDILYIHDTLQLFGDSEDMFHQEWRKLRREMHETWRNRCHAYATRISEPEHPGVVQASLIARSAGRSMDSSHIAAVLRVGLRFLHDE